jgi:hypothetical protein
MPISDVLAMLITCSLADVEGGLPYVCSLNDKYSTTLNASLYSWSICTGGLSYIQMI